MSSREHPSYAALGSANARSKSQQSLVIINYEETIYSYGVIGFNNDVLCVKKEVC